MVAASYARHALDRRLRADPASGKIDQASASLAEARRIRPELTTRKAVGLIGKNASSTLSTI